MKIAESQRISRTQYSINTAERHAAQAPALCERLPQIFNSQYSIKKDGSTWQNVKRPPISLENS